MREIQLITCDILFSLIVNLIVKLNQHTNIMFLITPYLHNLKRNKRVCKPSVENIKKNVKRSYLNNIINVPRLQPQAKDKAH